MITTVVVWWRSCGCDGREILRQGETIALRGRTCPQCMASFPELDSQLSLLGGLASSASGGEEGREVRLDRPQ
jgi:hypothetical protein